MPLYKIVCADQVDRLKVEEGIDSSRAKMSRDWAVRELLKQMPFVFEVSWKDDLVCEFTMLWAIPSLAESVGKKLPRFARSMFEHFDYDEFAETLVVETSAKLYKLEGTDWKELEAK